MDKLQNERLVLLNVVTCTQNKRKQNVDPSDILDVGQFNTVLQAVVNNMVERKDCMALFLLEMDEWVSEWVDSLQLWQTSHASAILCTRFPYNSLMNLNVAVVLCQCIVLCETSNAVVSCNFYVSLFSSDKTSNATAIKQIDISIVYVQNHGQMCQVDMTCGVESVLAALGIGHNLHNSTAGLRSPQRTCWCCWRTNGLIISGAGGFRLITEPILQIKHQQKFRITLCFFLSSVISFFWAVMLQDSSAYTDDHLTTTEYRSGRHRFSFRFCQKRPLTVSASSSHVETIMSSTRFFFFLPQRRRLEAAGVDFVVLATTPSLIQIQKLMSSDKNATLLGQSNAHMLEESSTSVFCSSCFRDDFWLQFGCTFFFFLPRSSHLSCEIHREVLDNLLISFCSQWTPHTTYKILHCAIWIHTCIHHLFNFVLIQHFIVVYFSLNY